MLKSIFNMPDSHGSAIDTSRKVMKPGSFAAILARAGVGKTALLVQIAVNGMLLGKNVLHISTADPVDKVDLWYREVFQRLDQEDQSRQINKMKDQLLRHRFIMTFETESFSIIKLEKRVNELISQDIFVPAQIMIDDFSFENVSDTDIDNLKTFVRKNGLVFWFSMRTHRDEAVDGDGIPTRLTHLKKWFDTMIRLEPESDRIYIRQIVGDRNGDEQSPALFLDPSTLLLREA